MGWERREEEQMKVKLIAMPRLGLWGGMLPPCVGGLRGHYNNSLLIVL